MSRFFQIPGLSGLGMSDLITVMAAGVAGFAVYAVWSALHTERCSGRRACAMKI